jgi:hypothetical protein
MPNLESESVFMEDSDTPEIQLMLRELYRMSMEASEKSEPIKKIRDQYPRIFKIPDVPQNTPKLRL